MDQLQQYLEYLQFERGLRPLTIQNYRRDLDVLFELKGQFAVAELQPVHIRRFIAMLHGRGLSGKTIARQLSGWRGFFDFLVKRHGATANPCHDMRAPKSPRSLPQALAVDQAVQLVDIECEDILSARDRAMLELFYSSGLRLSEVTGLDLDNLNLAEGIVTVTGKGNKTRIVPIGSQAIKAMQHWLEMRQPVASQGQQAVFLNRYGNRISGRAIQYRIKQWALRQDISSDVHPHMLRHSFASHVLQSSGDLRAVQEMLGHANISTTQVYTHLDFQHLSKVYDAAHPRARKK
ncbi:integrase/recombinase XerC [Methylobacillus rhizosphaerae]|uniref:Tyrosine recombinase XerC n=1 Tax=Methylobacillus rhizosphaerae TaxID=551994 RepID=A0A238Z6V7_9PROT|nr:tyrosine recombinase XerC [Methylobacillus rhizosphaerae]SNR78872.1 integrase/recombinase XerC [Methylobacillus rhizosphaerae]